MSTRHLSFTTETITSLSASADGSEIVEIEVPAGESHYRIQQKEGDPLAQHFVFHIRHENSQLLVTGLVEARGETAPSLKTSVIHHAQQTKAETIIRTLAYDSGQPHYEGLILMEPAAQGSESYLNHHSLLLGPKAKSWTLPSLEILANQVKCSHAATIKSLTDLDLFYLQSRGLNKEEATELLIEAFVSDIA